jgi:Bardet-Biedl syndrome 2 protein
MTSLPLARTSRTLLTRFRSRFWLHLQDLCTTLQVVELESLAEFPQEMADFRSVLLRVDEYNATRLKLTAEMADASNMAKTLVIKAEDARILGDIKAMRAAYAQLYSLNGELMAEYAKRANNHEQLLAVLKDVNHMIQKAARLRVGTAKARIVSACRAAIKANNIQSLFKIIKQRPLGGNPRALRLSALVGPV